jgi:hypothetical protein
MYSLWTFNVIFAIFQPTKISKGAVMPKNNRKENFIIITSPMHGKIFTAKQNVRAHDSRFDAHSLDVFQLILQNSEESFNELRKRYDITNVTAQPYTVEALRVIQEKIENGYFRNIFSAHVHPNFSITIVTQTPSEKQDPDLKRIEESMPAPTPFQL